MSIYAEALGSGWRNLSEPIRRLHENGAEGTFRVERRGIARFLPLLPPAGEKISIHLRVVPTPAGERWIRTFDGVHVISSTQRVSRGSIVERFGAMTITMSVAPSGDALRYHLMEARVLGLRLPQSWLPRTVASELTEGPFVRIVVKIGEKFGYSGLLRPR